jgi:hypothetical protein
MGEQLTKIIVEGLGKPCHDCARYVLNDFTCHSKSGCASCPCDCEVETHKVDDEEEEIAVT